MPHGDGGSIRPAPSPQPVALGRQVRALGAGGARADSMSAVRSHFEPLWVLPASDRARVGASLGGSLRARRPHSRGRAAGQGHHPIARRGSSSIGQATRTDSISRLAIKQSDTFPEWV
jgi:hypothetical protein